jgi:hypothetical protein
MNPKEFKRLLNEFKQPLKEEDIIPVGPDGNKITDPQVIKNLNMAIKAVDPSLRSKVKSLLTDPGAAAALKTPAQRTALIGAIAIAFGVTDQEFSQIAGKIKGVLKKTTTDTNDQA